MKKYGYALFLIASVWTSTSALAQLQSFPPSPSLTQLRNKANEGDPAAQASLAHAYHEGTDGLAKDDEEAIVWLRKAAEQGNIEGQFNLGIAYYHGLGVKKDITEAVKWFGKAAKQGYSEAQYVYAAAYQNGLGGLPKDLVESDVWLGMAAAQGNEEAARERISLEATMSQKDIADAAAKLEVRKQEIPMLKITTEEQK